MEHVTTVNLQLGLQAKDCRIRIGGLRIGGEQEVTSSCYRFIVDAEIGKATRVLLFCYDRDESGKLRVDTADPAEVAKRTADFLTDALKADGRAVVLTGEDAYAFIERVSAAGN